MKQHHHCSKAEVSQAADPIQHPAAMEMGQGWGKTLYPSFLLPKEKKPGLLCINFSACWTHVMSDFLKQVSYLCVRCVSELEQLTEESVKLLS